MFLKACRYVISKHVFTLIVIFRKGILTKKIMDKGMLDWVLHSMWLLKRVDDSDVKIELEKFQALINAVPEEVSLNIERLYCEFLNGQDEGANNLKDDLERFIKQEIPEIVTSVGELDNLKSMLCSDIWKKWGQHIRGQRRRRKVTTIQLSNDINNELRSLMLPNETLTSSSASTDDDSLFANIVNNVEYLKSENMRLAHLVDELRDDNSLQEGICHELKSINTELIADLKAREIKYSKFIFKDDLTTQAMFDLASSLKRDNCGMKLTDRIVPRISIYDGSKPSMAMRLDIFEHETDDFDFFE
jgi:hypothetical protein